MFKNKKIMGDNIQYFMDEMGVDRHQLAKALNIPYSSLTDWINGKSYPRIDKIEMLAKYFNVPKSALVERRYSKGADGEQIVFPVHYPERLDVVGLSKLHLHYDDDELLYFIEKYIEKNYKNILRINIETYADAFIQYIRNQCSTFDQIGRYQKYVESKLFDRIEKLENQINSTEKETPT